MSIHQTKKTFDPSGTGLITPVLAGLEDPKSGLEKRIEVHRCQLDYENQVCAIEYSFAFYNQGGDRIYSEKQPILLIKDIGRTSCMINTLDENNVVINQEEGDVIKEEELRLTGIETQFGPSSRESIISTIKEYLNIA